MTWHQRSAYGKRNVGQLEGKLNHFIILYLIQSFSIYRFEAINFPTFIDSDEGLLMIAPSIVISPS